MTINQLKDYTSSYKPKIHVMTSMSASLTKSTHNLSSNYSSKREP